MLYSIICEYVEDNLTKRNSARSEHLAGLEALRDQGRLLIAGPNPAIDSPDPGRYTGSIIIAEFESYDEAKTWVDAEPYVSAGVYRSVTVKPFRKTLP